MKLTFWQKRRRNSNVFLFFCLNSNQEYSILKEKRKKLPETFGRYVIKFLPLHPLSERRQSIIDLLIKKPVLLRTPFSFLFYLPFAKRDDEKKKKRKKTSEIIWKIYLKVLTFASAFWKEKQFEKRSDLWRIYINNTSSTRAECYSG